jgi:hypothetical protein
MAWGYYNLTQGHCLKGCGTFVLGVHDIWFNGTRPLS